MKAYLPFPLSSHYRGDLWVDSIQNGAYDRQSVQTQPQLFITPRLTNVKPEDLDANKFLLMMISVDPQRVADRLVHWMAFNIPGDKIEQGQTAINYSGTPKN